MLFQFTMLPSWSNSEPEEYDLVVGLADGVPPSLIKNSEPPNVPSENTFTLLLRSMVSTENLLGLAPGTFTVIQSLAVTAFCACLACGNTKILFPAGADD